MPAWGVTHDDESIWGMVALMKRFPGMSEHDYKALVDEAASHHDRNGGHDHDSHQHD